MAGVQWSLLIVVLLIGITRAFLWINEMPNESPGYGVRHHVVRGYAASDGTLTSSASYRYNAPPKDDREDKKKGDVEGKNDDDTNGGSKEKNTGEVEKASSKDTSSVKEDESTTEDKSDKKYKTKKDKKDESGDTVKAEKGSVEDDTAKAEKGSAEDEDAAKEDTADEHIATGDDTQIINSMKSKPIPKSDPRGGRSLTLDDLTKESKDSSGKTRVLELSINLGPNDTTTKEKSEVDCVQNETYVEILGSLDYIIDIAREIQITTHSLLVNMFAVDCSDIVHLVSESSLHTFNIEYKGKRPVTVMCDMGTDGGGWTVVQRRIGNSKQMNFNRGWYEYKVGFGDPAGEYWVGLDNLYAWTNMRQYQLRIELMDYEGNCKYALYKQFYVEDEQQGYRLHVSGYVGNAGDALTRQNVKDNFTAEGMMFSTIDRDNDMASNANCAQLWKTGGWWYNRCAWANLNGPSWMEADGSGIGINWHTWRNKEHLKSAVMMIKPVGRV